MDTMDLQADSGPATEDTTSNIDNESSILEEPVLTARDSDEKTSAAQSSESKEVVTVREKSESKVDNSDQNDQVKTAPPVIALDDKDEPAQVEREDTPSNRENDMLDVTQLGDKVTLRKKQNREIASSDEENKFQSVADKLEQKEEKTQDVNQESSSKVDDEISKTENTAEQLKNTELEKATIEQVDKSDEILCENVVTSNSIETDIKTSENVDCAESFVENEAIEKSTDKKEVDNTSNKKSIDETPVVSEQKIEADLSISEITTEGSSNLIRDEVCHDETANETQDVAEDIVPNTSEENPADSSEYENSACDKSINESKNEDISINESKIEDMSDVNEEKNETPDDDVVMSFVPDSGGAQQTEGHKSDQCAKTDTDFEHISNDETEATDKQNDEVKDEAEATSNCKQVNTNSDENVTTKSTEELSSGEAKNKARKENNDDDDDDVIMVESDLNFTDNSKLCKTEKNSEHIETSLFLKNALPQETEIVNNVQNENKTETVALEDKPKEHAEENTDKLDTDTAVTVAAESQTIEKSKSSDLSGTEKDADIVDKTTKENDIEIVNLDDEPEEPDSAANTDDPKPDAAESVEKSDTLPTNAKDSSENTKPDEMHTEKTFVLDEKLGVFEEKTTQPEEKIPQLISGDSDEDVVMIEDDEPAPSTTKASFPGPKVVAGGKLDLASVKRNVVVSKEAKPKTIKPPSFDCVNPDCAKVSTETAPAPGFVLNFYNLPKKSKKQRVCLVCYDQVVEKYSEMCESLVDQQPLLFCKMPQKNELVEISDSSEEEEDDSQQETGKPLSSDIISLVETELQDILTSTFEKINLSKQIEWTEQIMKQKIAYNSRLSDEINNELNELQRKVDRIHLNLYSKSRPRYHDLPPCNIFHEVDLMNKNQQSVLGQSTHQPSQSSARQFSPQKAQPAQNQQQQTQKPLVSLPVAAKNEEFVRPAVVVGQFYFAVKHKLLSNWAECQVVETVSASDKTLYKVNFLHNQGGGNAPIKVVPAKFLAYRHSFNVKLPLGTRVIARFDAGTTQPSYKLTQATKSTSFYPGIIAESFGKYNRHRYLIFFDDGYAQYVCHGDVRVVCEESKEVWLDIHPHSQEFIRNYLLNYRSQRPMVQVKVGQRIITEWKGKWIYAKVIDIDASLVQLHFPEDNRFEWIYRGSTRLGPLYQEKALSMSKMSSNKFSKFQKRNEPSIEYITIDDDENDQNKQDSKKQPTPQEQALQSYQQQNKVLQQQSSADAAANRSVAKKSTFHRAVVSTSQPSAVFMNSSTIYCEDDRPKGKIVYYTAKKHLPPLKYKPHECNPNCLFKITHNLKSYSPLAKPLLSGWERQLCKMKYKKVYVVYRAPCGRRLRNMYELHKYLRMTKATLNVENYDFDPMVHCLAEYVIENHIYHNPDLSDGREYMAVPCVNYFDDSKPPPCVYSTERIPTEGVNLNLDSDFMCGCDCEDDCIDKSRCQCWQLTIAGAKFGNPNTSIDNIGYVYKRLQETVVTGIYECNSRCKCNNSCLNRVVQHPLQTKLQVFKTSNRGWGIRCLNDVSKGSFICIYSGHLLTEEAGNMICQMNANKAGDEYFADLDYIETVEQLKEGYETDVVESESENDSDEPDYDAKRDSDASDDDFTTNVNPSNAVVKTRSQVRRDSTKRTEPKLDKKYKKKEDTKNESDDEREMVSLVPNAEMIITKEDETNTSIKYRSVRKLFGKDEKIYIMDAKKSGNLGRYFNHSCNPNLFVQNVFVDTHDLRFPWVAFFALSNIRAGSELTWNYNYDVGSVEGKVLYCQCGAENCRQRLL
ncbi:histone-lysine N-methyltransferase eggless [Wyeomyia smithii]|uniref:histone-lysine N-methyltransferase eggless n=1 Tax=Wyeomyia smithii TaxID=174621 RepID=UPI0024681E0C|nr:histone-lysine N-methyltransferase eggless [Wyeomyia smithii]XP_055545072.1 histone-lysine N-methyltransferase eggless [Wyeomyia smithii]